MKKNKKVFLIVLIMSLIIPSAIYAEGEMPNIDMLPQSGMTTNREINYVGANNISEDGTYDGISYTSIDGNQNALLVNNGTVILNNPVINKTGSGDNENADFYGTNAAILAYSNASLTINGGSITTDGSYANGIFSYGSGVIAVTDTIIKTSSSNSGGIMVSGGGTINAINLAIETDGNSSAAIRSDRGGGVIEVDGGTYKTNGIGSPAIYSTANISVKNASLYSTKSEGIVIEGANSVTLDNVKLEDDNTTLNGLSETYKNIFMYQSMSGDATVGTSTFTSTGSTLNTSNGDTFFVTNTNALINLENNDITNANGALIRIEKGSWGEEGNNGGNVELNLINQKIESNDVIVDSISTLKLSLKNSSFLETRINKENTAKGINLDLSSDSIISLTDDSYITSLTNEDLTNSNIYSNGYKLYVDGVETPINNGVYNSNVVSSDTIDIDDTSSNSNTFYVVILISVIAISIVGITMMYKKAENI